MRDEPTLFDPPAAKGSGQRPLRNRSKSAGRTLLKWPGGKTNELQMVAPLFPEHERLIDPFVGGGAALFTSIAPRAAVNDACPDLMNVYSYVQNQTAEFFDLLGSVEHWWTSISELFDRRANTLLQALEARRTGDESAMDDELTGVLEDMAASCPSSLNDLCEYTGLKALKPLRTKVARMLALEDKQGRLSDKDALGNLEGAAKAVVYTAIRSEYNHHRLGRLGRDDVPKRTVYFFFLREYTYAAMFRFNASDEFNVPYGGMSYNRKNWLSKIESLSSAEVIKRLQTTDLFSEDFEVFAEKANLTSNDFVFLDPPYDSDFSLYDNRPFDLADHHRLAGLMKELPCPFMMVIKATDAVEALYSDPRWSSFAFDKTYLWTIKERNDRRAQHLVITNYEPPCL